MRTEKGASVSASPRVAGLSAIAPATGATRAFHRRHARPAPARVAGLAIRSSNGKPSGEPVTGAGAIPKNRLPTSMSFAPPPALRKTASRCGHRGEMPLRTLHFDGLTTCMSPPTSCLVTSVEPRRSAALPCNPQFAGFPSFCVGFPACHAPKSLTALAARRFMPVGISATFGRLIRFVSIPPALASRTGRFPGCRPRFIRYPPQAAGAL